MYRYLLFLVEITLVSSPFLIQKHHGKAQPVTTELHSPNFQYKHCFSRFGRISVETLFTWMKASAVNDPSMARMYLQFDHLIPVRFQSFQFNGRLSRALHHLLLQPFLDVLLLLCDVFVMAALTQHTELTVELSGICKHSRQKMDSLVYMS